MSTQYNVKIQTLTPVYDHLEDRIRLAVNYQDISTRIDLMITRAFILQFLPVIEEYIIKHYPDDVVEDYVEVDLHTSQEQSKKDSNQITKTDKEDLSLYQNIEDLLYTVNLTYDKESSSTVVKFISKENHTAFLIADSKLLNNVLTSIKNSIPKISWGISTYF